MASGLSRNCRQSGAGPSPLIEIRGAGIFGLSCAFELARRGASLRVVDDAGVGAGASGGTVGALAPHVPENWNPKKQFQLESLLMAEGFWAEVARTGGADPGYARTGRIQPLGDDQQVARARERATGAATHWGVHATWEVVPADRFETLATHSPTGLVVHDTLSGRISPRAACRALVAALTALGVEIHSESTDLEPADVTLHATGARGLADLSQALGRAVGTGIKGQSALFRFDAAQAPQLYVQSLHLIPHADGTLAVGSTTERAFDTPNGTDAQLEDLIAEARRLVPQLETAPVIDRWAGLRPRARTRAPMLGPWPGRPGHFIANGGFKIGLGMAPKVATTMADLILEDRDTIPAGFHVSDNL